MNADDVLDAMQELTVRDGQPPSIQAIAQAVGRSKQAVLHYFPDRDALEAALAARALGRVDAEMTAAARRGDAAATYLRLSVPTGDDRAVALTVLGSLRTRASLPPEVDEAIDRWERLIAEELGSPVRAEVVRLVADGLFVEALVGAPPPPARVEALVDHLVGPGSQRNRP
jgi:AcrR family transcriptional regulator